MVWAGQAFTDGVGRWWVEVNPAAGPLVNYKMSSTDRTRQFCHRERTPCLSALLYSNLWLPWALTRLQREWSTRLRYCRIMGTDSAFFHWCHSTGHLMPCCVDEWAAIPDRWGKFTSVMCSHVLSAGSKLLHTPTVPPSGLMKIRHNDELP